MSTELRKVVVPELGPSRYVRELSWAASVRSRALAERAKKGEDLAELAADQVILVFHSCVVDEDGKRIYPTEEAASDALEDLSPAAVGAVMKAFGKLSAAPKKKGAQGNA